MISLRKATAADCEIVWQLNNDPDARAQSLSSASIPWADHQKWYAQALSDPKMTMWMIEVDGATGGVVRLHERDRTVISIALAKEQRGKGVASEAIAKACTMHGGPIDSLVIVGNAASLRAFEKAGFHERDRTTINGKAVVVLTWP